MRVKFLLFSIESAGKFSQALIWIGKFLQVFFPFVQDDLEKANLEVPVHYYLTAAFFSALIYGIVFFALTLALGFLTAQFSFVVPLIAGLFFLAVFLVLHAVYPKIIALHLALELNQSLILALRSLLIQVSAGVSLYDAMVNVSKADYGAISKEFEKVVKRVSAGESETSALEKIALHSRSEYLRKACWQMITSLRSGSSLSLAINSVIDLLSAEQLRSIKNYAAELNLWLLMYLLFAAAIPTLGITFLVVFSALGGMPVQEVHVLLIIAASFIIQVLMVGFVKTRVPRVFA